MDNSYLENVMTDHLVFMQTLFDIFCESEDPDAVRLAGNALGVTKTGQDYLVKMRQEATQE